MATKTLDVYLNNVLAGKLKQVHNGSLTFQYQENYLQFAKHAISISLPLQRETFTGHKVEAYFSGLLPDDFPLQKISKAMQISKHNTFALLKILGGECAGALSLHPEGELPEEKKQNDIQALTNDDLLQIIEILRRKPLLVGETKMRLSLAGAQDKLAVGYQKKKVLLIKGATPTTHILKPPIHEFEDSVHNEYFCMQLAKCCGITVPNTMIHYANESTPCYLVERYDRINTNQNNIQRLHQEDFCQALALTEKYQNAGGPSFKDCQELISACNKKPAIDQARMIQILIFNYLIANSDAHGKNFAFIYNHHKPDLAPAYDLLSTGVYPDHTEKMAMKIGSQYEPMKTLLRHWHQCVPDTVLAKQHIEKQLLKLSTLLPQEAERLKKQVKAEENYRPIIDKICDIIEIRSQYLIKQLNQSRISRQTNF